MPIIALGQVPIDSVIPEQNQIAVPAGTDIRVFFNTGMNSSTINDTTFVVMGHLSGMHSGTINYVQSTRTAIFNPAQDFVTGEVVTAVLTTAVEDSLGQPIDGYEWNFTVHSPNGTGYFSMPISSAAHDGPQGLCAAYMNNDVNLDIVVTNVLSSDVSVLIGNGDGTFNAPLSVSTGLAPLAVACGDIDEDGDIDCAVSAAGEEMVYVYTNDGTGVLTQAGQYPVNAYPLHLTISDLNMDGHLDIVTANYSSNDVSVLIGNGDGSFQNAAHYPAGQAPRSVGAGDIDGDGDIDLLVSLRIPKKVRVLFNNGDGSFVQGEWFGTGIYPERLFLASLNNADNFLDVVTANVNDNNVSCLFGNGDGTFGIASNYSVILAPKYIVCADLNADNDLDILTCNTGVDSISILFNDSQGNFAIHNTVFAGDSTLDICSGDFDNDGSTDLAVACYNSDSIAILLNFTDQEAPGPPENLVANGANPSPWTFNPVFVISWTNPPDSSGIKRALYKLTTAPAHDYDTTGTMRSLAPDTVIATIQGGQMLYVWLEDNAGNVDYTQRSQVELRLDTVPPTNAVASSPQYSTTTNFTVSWTAGNDTGGSGLSGAYDVKVKDGTGSWGTWLSAYAGLSASFPGADGHVYYFEAAARDSAGNIEQFLGVAECSTRVDTTKPRVISTYPASGDTGIAPNTQVSARFSEKTMDTTTMIPGNFTIEGNSSYTFSVVYTQGDSTVRLDPTMNFGVHETLTVTVSQQVRDRAGNMMTADYVWSFVTGASSDSLGPATSSANAIPNPTEPIAFVEVTANVTDEYLGNNNIDAAEFFVDSTGTPGSGISMAPSDTFWDEIEEAVWGELDTDTLGWTPGTSHLVFVHGKDAVGNWGNFDTTTVNVIADDDTIGPALSNFTPTAWPDTIGFDIECVISDSSGVYDDDSTGSDGQGIYLLWDNDGELSIDAYEVTLSLSTGSYYKTDSLIPAQSAGVNFVYEVYAYDNDYDTDHPGDRTQGSSGEQTVDIQDVRGPTALNTFASPNPTGGEDSLAVTSFILDSLVGGSIIYGAEYFVDAPGIDSTGIQMAAVDGAFDEISEQVSDTLDVSTWPYGVDRWLFVHGLDIAGNWGGYDSVLVYVTEAEDTIAPYVVETTPDSGETNVVLNRNIFITFSEPMDTASFDTSTLYITGSINSSYTYALLYDSVEYAVELNPDSLFASNETLVVDVSEQVRDASGLAMANPYSFFFVTGTGLDTIGPEVIAKNAYPDTTQGAHYSYITATISDSMVGRSIVREAEFFIDSVGTYGDGYRMAPVDGWWNEVEEDVFRDHDVSLLSLGVHRLYIHGQDDADNWGAFDSLDILITPDDDTLGPLFSDFYPDSVPDTSGFRISCVISDVSGVYDDSTGSNGQGVYVLWDYDGELAVSSHETRMSVFVGDTFRTDLQIPVQNDSAQFVYEVYAYDNDFDFGEPEDRTLGTSGIQQIVVYDSRGPRTSYIQVSPPNPPAGISQVVVYATVSDSIYGLSVVYGAEAFLDSIEATGTGFAMAAVDGGFDETVEDVYDTIPVSGWQAGESHTFYVHGRDVVGNWGSFDSLTVYVAEVVDTIPPWIAYTSPDSADTSVATNTWIYVTFTERVDPATVTSDKILIEGDVGGAYTFWMSYNDFDSTLSINPYNDFAAYESVNVYIASGIQDLTGNPMSSNYWWWFRIGAAPDTLGPVVTMIDVSPDTAAVSDTALLTGTLSDNHEVMNAEYFIDYIGSNGSGYPVQPVDSFGTNIVDVFDTVFTDTLGFGQHMIYLHGVDGSGNWGVFDSVLFVISGADTIGPVFDIFISPQSAAIGDSVRIRAVPDEALHPDSAVICSVWTATPDIHTIELLPDTVGYSAWLSTIGFDVGDCGVKVSGYDVWINYGASPDTFNVTAQGEFLPERMVYAWPNPARDDRVYFHFYVNANASVTVDVFDLEGKRVTRLEGTGLGGNPPHLQSSNVIEWNITRVASDVYIFKLTAESEATGEKRSVMKKLAIVK
jgi:hypothetical protein